MDNQSSNSFKLKFNHQLYNYWKNTGSRLFKFTKIDCRGIEKITENEPAILTPNHLNWKDIFLTASLIRRPINFVASFKLFDKHACYKLLEQYFQKFFYPGMKVGFHVGSPLYIEEFLQPSERQTLSIFIKELQQTVFHLIYSQK